MLEPDAIEPANPHNTRNIPVNKAIHRARVYLARTMSFLLIGRANEKLLQPEALSLSIIFIKGNKAMRTRNIKRSYLCSICPIEKIINVKSKNENIPGNMALNSFFKMLFTEITPLSYV